ncbi:galactonate dehydratase [Ruania alkalisoli]|uniref:Galactonate dehydratase n=1 Tax=Ruania alkalisoli TaxID=2779775 RepID=A0A7M1SW38_9MICO|nr:galactonate dehydratase [Ruania alkalisoli]QOR71800.1 galactonate dehydratase [Ruania alkalisoli]
MSRRRIVDVETFVVSSRCAFVKVSTDDGLVGWGEPVLEARADTVVAAVAQLRDLLIGAPVEIERLWQRMYKSGFYRGGPILGSAVAGIDQALWDLTGKALGVPVHELLGGPVRDVLPLYAPCHGSDISALRDRATELTEAGYRMVKTAPDGPREFAETSERIRHTMDRITAVHESVGPDRLLAVDFHGRLSLPGSRGLLAELEGLQLAFVEEPVAPQYQHRLGALCAATTVPIATGERLYDRWEVAQRIESGIAVLQPDLSHCFGISEAMRIATLASIHDVALAPHCATGPLAFAACVQVGFAVPEVMVQECPLELHEPGRNPLLRFVDHSAFDVHEGTLRRPLAPGLGVEVDEAAVRAAAAAPEHTPLPIWQRRDGSYGEW